MQITFIHKIYFLRVFILALTNYLFIQNFLLAQTGGNSTYAFLKLPVSARSASMGGYLISANDSDLNLIADNPAILDEKLHQNVSISYINYISDIYYSNVSYAYNLNKIGSFSASLQYLNYGNFTQADVTGLVTGEFSANEFASSIYYSRKISKRIKTGVGFKYISSRLQQFNSNGYAIDAGAIYSSKNENLSLAFVLKNIGRQMVPYTPGNFEPLPFDAQMGITYKIKHAPFKISVLAHHLHLWDLTYTDPTVPPQKTDPITGEAIIKKFTFDKLARHFNAGVEFSPAKSFNLRIGYNHQRREELKLATRPGISGFSFGAGIRVYKFNISYARALYHLAGASNHFTLTSNLSDFISKGNN
jgi:hypothetical protein